MWNAASCSQAGLCLGSSYVVIGTLLHSCRAIISVPTRKWDNHRERQQALRSFLLCVRSFKKSLKRSSGIMKALTHFQSTWQDSQEEATRLGGLHHPSWFLGTDPWGGEIWGSIVWSQDGIEEKHSHVNSCAVEVSNSRVNLLTLPQLILFILYFTCGSSSPFSLLYSIRKVLTHDFVPFHWHNCLNILPDVLTYITWTDT